MKRLLLLLWLLCVNLPAQSGRDFRLPTLDGRAELTGRIDFPAAKHPPVVVMVPGTGLFDRDVLMGNSGTDRDFLFRDLAGAFLARGIAVARFDYRGVRCNPRTMPPCPTCTTAADRQAHYLHSCIDNAVRGGVTGENLREDIATVYRYASTQPEVDGTRTALFGHSEGTMHIGHLVEDGLGPTSVLLMGAVTESPRELVHWQVAGRFLRIFDWDQDGDGKLTNAEIERGYRADSWFADFGTPLSGLLSPTGFWTRATFTDVLEKQYARSERDARAAKDTDPYPPAQPYVLASYRWWKQFFDDTVPNASRLAKFRGQVIFHNGTIDCQTPGVRELDLLRPYLAGFAKAPWQRLHAGFGHGMSKHPLLGPIDPAIREAIADDLAASLRR